MRDLRLEWEFDDSETWCRSLPAFANRMIKVFTPSFAHHRNTNVRYLGVKESLARMDPSRFRVVTVGAGAADPKTSCGPRPGKGARHLC